MHKIRWTEKKVAQRLALIEPLAYRRQSPLPPFRYHLLASPLEEPLVAPALDDSAWPTIEPEASWGALQTDFMLRTTFRVAQEWAAYGPLALYLPIGDAGEFSHPEALAYIDGTPYAAIDRHHHELLLPPHCCDGRPHSLALHGYVGRLAGAPGSKLLMRPCFVVQIDQATRDFIATVRVALGAVRSMDENNPLRGDLLNALDRAFILLDTSEPFGESFYDSVPAAHAGLRAGLDRAGTAMPVTILATGHAHIDLAWLWPLGQTIRKAGRTFHNVLRYMEQYPAYHFSQSQPQLYEFVRQSYPDLFAAIKQRVAQGRWEPLGGMWVEADCNLTGPESLARQFLLGRRFFGEHFGKDADSPVLWLPDVFGYAWNLPQLIKQAELEYFFTIKIGWSQYNRLPYDSFWWQGLDGTKVLTHFSTTPDPGGYGGSTYNARATAESALGTWTNFQQKEQQHDLLMAFGHGDGGGGPTREMIENIDEMRSFPGLPQMRQGAVGDFFRKLEAEAGAALPTWNGELYLELHRGAYTTQSRNKRANRKSEFLLHDAEALAVQASLLDSGYRYPAEALRRAWELVCLNQFHDIIPGSSINAVYVESQAQYEQVRRVGEDIRSAALQAIGRKIGAGVLLANPTGFVRADLALWPGRLAGEEHLEGPAGPILTQETQDGTLLAAGELAPYSVTALARTAGAPPPVENTLAVSPALLENTLLRVELNEAGDITRIYDKRNQRDVLPPGAIANQLQAFEDRPMRWDAWDLDIFYDDKMWTADPAESVQVVESGPLRAMLEIKRRIRHSRFTQRVSLAHHSPRLDIATVIDWRERHILLKAAFPVDVLSPVATHEIQWGNVERPTHRNTSWDWARFETCAQKWIDLSEGGYGVSLLNDCKYGHDVRDNVMRISLLRSPTAPDPEADQGEQRFAYSLLPHAGRWNEETVRAAYALNDPLLAVAVDGAQPATEALRSQSLLAVDKPNVVIETVKQAEDGHGVIVRLYESQRRRGRVALTAGFALAAAWQTNLLEENQAALTTQGNRITFDIRPYQIITLRLMPEE